MNQNSAVLIMDYQHDILKLIGSKKEEVIRNAKALLERARSLSIPVIFVKVGIKACHPEISTRNKHFSTIKKENQLLLDHEGTSIHPDVAPRMGESIIVKHCVGPFLETNLQTILRAHNIDNLILAGISTSGVVLSSIRNAADADYTLTVVSDACADVDDKVHNHLMEKIFPKQADVKTTDEVLSSMIVT